MLNISEYTQNAFKNGNAHVDVVIHFKNSIVEDITNENILLESMSLQEMLCDEEQIKFGDCNSSQFNISVAGVDEHIKNEEISVTLIVDEEEIPFGTYIIADAIKKQNTIFYDIKAYDKLYTANRDVTDWYLQLDFPMTLKTFRDSLFTHLGIEQEITELPFDNLLIDKNFSEGDNINGRTLIENICELSGCFGKMDRNGSFLYKKLKNVSDSDIDLSNPNVLKGKSIYSSFVTNFIDGIMVFDNNGTIFNANPNATNPYQIVNNFLMYNRTREELETICNTMLPLIDYVFYQPCESVISKGLPWIETGDTFKITSNSNYIYSYVLTRYLSGIQAMTDEYKANGKEILEYDTSDVSYQLAKLNASNAQMKIDFSSTQEGVKLAVSKAEDAVKAAEDATEAATNSLADAKRYTDAQVKASSEQVIISVSEQYATKNALDKTNTELLEARGEITATANEVGLKVSKGDVVSEVNANADKVSLISNNVEIITNDFKLQNGQISCNVINSNFLNIGNVFKVMANRSAQVGGLIYAEINTDQDFFMFRKEITCDENIATNKSFYGNGLNIIGVSKLMGNVFCPTIIIIGSDETNGSCTVISKSNLKIENKTGNIDSVLDLDAGYDLSGNPYAAISTNGKPLYFENVDSVFKHGGIHIVDDLTISMGNYNTPSFKIMPTPSNSKNLGFYNYADGDAFYFNKPIASETLDAAANNTKLISSAWYRARFSTAQFNANVSGQVCFKTAANRTNLTAIGSRSAEGGRIDYIGANSSGTVAIYGEFGTVGTYTGRTIATTASDIRLKTNINPTRVDALEVINQIDMVEFDWTDKTEHWNVGMIADEIEQIDPNLTFGGGYDEEGIMNVKGVNDFYLLGYCVKAIQELSAENKRLHEEINILKEKMEVM